MAFRFAASRSAARDTIRLPSKTSPNKIRLALIFGGRSGEHEISLRSAASVREALDPNRYDLIEYFIDPGGKWHPHPISPDFGGTRVSTLSSRSCMERS